MTTTHYVSDYKGNNFPITSYKRIISLVPSLTDLLFSFGLETSIVGVTKYCTFPAHAMDKPREIVGGTKNPDIKKIISLKPDIVLMNEEENQLKHYDRLIEAGIQTFVTFPRNVPEALSMFHDLQKLFCIGNVPELDQLEELVQEISSQINHITMRKRIFCPIWKKPWMSFNNDTFASGMIEFCGGENITGPDSERYPEISLEEIIKANPDIILLPDEPYHFTEADKQELLRIFSPQHPIIKLVSGTFHWYSFIMIQSLQTLRKIFLQTA